MKGFIIIAFASCLAKATFAQTGDGSLEDIFKYDRGQLAASIQKHAKPLDASEIDDFKEGFAIIRKGENYAVINSSAQIIIPYGKYKFNIKLGYSIDRENCGFYNGMCLVRDPETEKYGFISNNMELVVPCTLIQADPYMSDGYAWAKQLDAKGKEETVFIDSRGKKYRLKDQNLYSHAWCDAYPVPSLNNSNNFYSKDGKLLFNTKRWFRKIYSEGLLQVDTNDNIRGERTGFIDLRGKLVIPYQFKGTFYSGFHEGLNLFTPRTSDEFKYLYIDRKGKPVITLNNMPEFPDLNLDRANFSYGRAFSNQGNNSILIDTTGRIIDFNKLMLSKNRVLLSSFETFDIRPIDRQGPYIRFSASFSYHEDKQGISGGMSGGRKYTYKQNHNMQGIGIARLDGTIMVAPFYSKLDFPDVATGIAKGTFIFSSQNHETTVTGYVGRYSVAFQLFEMILPIPNNQ